MSSSPPTPPDAELLARGELTVRGRVREASNAVLYCSVSYEGREAACVYKPVAGEQPLWDFPDGTLAQREVAAYEISEATGWGLVPPTVLREGPYGEGMVQLWIEADPGARLLALTEDDEAGEGWKAVGPAQVDEDRTALLVHADTPELRRLANFAHLNLMNQSYPFDKDVDVIFLRNVLIYFEKADQDRVVQRLVGHLRPGGYLVLGHSESMIGTTHPVRQVAPAVFQKL